MLYIYIATGAAAGALLRHLLNVLLNPMNKLFSTGILVSNILGACLIGVFLAYISNNDTLNSDTRIILTSGFLGSLTTFSGFSAEVFILFQNSKLLLGVLIICSHVLGCVLCTAIFYYLTTHFLRFFP